MEAIIGTVVAIAMSFGYTEVKMRKHQKEYKTLVERVDVMEQNLGRNMLGAMLPMSSQSKNCKKQLEYDD